jgi:hypothetical protein
VFTKKGQCLAGVKNVQIDKMTIKCTREIKREEQQNRYLDKEVATM